MQDPKDPKKGEPLPTPEDLGLPPAPPGMEYVIAEVSPELGKAVQTIAFDINMLHHMFNQLVLAFGRNMGQTDPQYFTVFEDVGLQLAFAASVAREAQQKLLMEGKLPPHTPEQEKLYRGLMQVLRDKIAQMGEGLIEGPGKGEA